MTNHIDSYVPDIANETKPANLDSIGFLATELRNFKVFYNLFQVAMVSDMGKPLGTATRNMEAVNVALIALQSAYDIFRVRTDNPHSVTKAQVGLNLVNNTTDALKPISSATQVALNLKLNSNAVGTASTKNFRTTFLGSSADVALHTTLEAVRATLAGVADTHIALTNNPHGVTKTQVGLSLIPNALSSLLTANSTAQLATTSLTFQINALVTTLTTTVTGNKTGTDAQAVTSNNHISASANPHGVTKTQVGLSVVDNTTDANKPISSATQTALNLKAPLSDTYTRSQLYLKTDLYTQNQLNLRLNVITCWVGAATEYVTSAMITTYSGHTMQAGIYVIQTSTRQYTIGINITTTQALGAGHYLFGANPWWTQAMWDGPNLRFHIHGQSNDGPTSHESILRVVFYPQG